MREGGEPTIEFLNGYLYALANFCYGCNYVPVYGAEELLLNDSNIEKALINNLGSKSNYSKFKRVEITAKQQLEILINKWVAKKYLTAKGLKMIFHH